MHIVSVVPAGSGWAVRSDAVADLLFRSGARAEAAAKRLARALAAAGKAVDIRIHLRDGSLGARLVCPPDAAPAAP